MAKVTPVLWKHKSDDNSPRERKEYPIYLRIYASGQTKYKSLRVRVHPRHWNERQRRVRKSCRRHGQINALISGKLADAEDAALQATRAGRKPSADELKGALEEEEPQAETEEADFFSYAMEVRERFRRREQVHSVVKHKATAKKLRGFWEEHAGKGAPLPFAAITPALLREWETHMRDALGNAQSTAAANLRAVRSVLYKAIKDGHLSQADNPFFQFKINRGGQPDRDKLTLEQVNAVEGLGLASGSLIHRTRDYFLFSLYCAGIRFSDVALMKRRSVTGGRLVYRMKKTGKERNLRLLPPALEIARRHLDAQPGAQSSDLLFPILTGKDLSTERKRVTAIANENALVNKYLKKIARRAEIDASVSFHVARHSFATIALRGGWDVAEISQALGHSSLKVTEQYLKGFDDTDLDDKMSDLFGGER